MNEYDANNELNTQIQYRLIEKLTASESLYRELVERLREIVFECDLNGRIIFLNHAWQEFLGHTIQESVGRSLEDFISEFDRPLWRSALQQRLENRLELRFVHQTQEILWLELSVRFGEEGKLIGSLNNIMEHKLAESMMRQTNQELERKVQSRTQELSRANVQLSNTLKKLQTAQSSLIQKEKMSSLGQLVAGVAHEINNPVSFIHGNLDHVQTYVQDLISLVQTYQKRYPEPGDAIRLEADRIDLDFILKDLPKALTSMRMGSNRICEIVLSLRSFSRLHESILKTVNIHEGLENTLTILNHRLKATSRRPAIEVVKHYDHGLPPA